MTYDYVRDHEHELEVEYLSASDVAVLNIYSVDDSLFIGIGPMPDMQ